MLVSTIRMPEESPPSLRAEWPYALALLTFFVAASVATGAHRDVPVIDDWTYAWSVEQLRYHGRLAMLDWSSIFPIGPALWGTGVVPGLRLLVHDAAASRRWCSPRWPALPCT